MPNYRMRTYDPAAQASVSWSYKGVEDEEESIICHVLIVKFIGKYGADGASGRENARIMDAAVAFGLSAWDPKKVVLDLSDCEYSWGDNIQNIFSRVLNAVDLMEVIFRGKSADEAHLPLKVVVSDKNESGLTSLFESEMSQDSQAFFCTSVGQALLELLGEMPA